MIEDTISFLSEEGGEPDISRNALLPATIFIGLIAVAQTIVPVLTWYFFVDPNNYASNTWTRNTWMTLWIGNIATFGVAALMWPLSYAHEKLAMVYGWSWMWAKGLEGLLMITVVTMLLISGIQDPTDKTVWETLVVYIVT